MKVVDESRQKTTDLEEESALIAEALIKKARRRQWRRRLLVGLIVLVVGLASGIWAMSADGTRAPTSKRTGPARSAAGSAARSRHANPLRLVGVWRVTDTGVRPAPVVSVGSLGLLVWQPCGWASGGWNANQQGLFVGNLTGGAAACALTAGDLNPRWLAAATAYKATGRDELIVGSTGGVLARLVPTTVPKALRKGFLPAYVHPVVTPQLRKDLLKVNLPLPSGLVPATAKQLVGAWVPASLPLKHWRQTPHLTFTSDRNWSGSDGCNGLGGRWSLGRGGSLVVVSMGSTLIGCDNVSVEWWLFKATRAAFRGRLWSLSTLAVP